MPNNISYDIIIISVQSGELARIKAYTLKKERKYIDYNLVAGMLLMMGR